MIKIFKRRKRILSSVFGQQTEQGLIHNIHLSGSTLQGFSGGWVTNNVVADSLSPVGYAVDFAVASDWLRSRSDSTLIGTRSEFTVETCFALTSSISKLFSVFLGSGAELFSLRHTGNGDLYLYVAGTAYPVTSYKVPLDGTYKEYVLCSKNSILTLYVNGTSVWSMNISTVQDISGTVIFSGIQSDYTTNAVQGETGGMRLAYYRLYDYGKYESNGTPGAWYTPANSTTLVAMSLDNTFPVSAGYSLSGSFSYTSGNNGGKAGSFGSSEIISTPVFDFLSAAEGCMECWCYPTSYLTDDPYATNTIFWGGRAYATSYFSLGYSHSPTYLPGAVRRFMMAVDGPSCTSPQLLIADVESPVNNWYHLAVTKSAGNVFSMYVNGVRRAQKVISGAYSMAGAGCRIGSSDYSTNYRRFKGRIQDVRVSVGNPIYTGAFVPPTTRLP